jgi:hypothetical protein
VSALLGVTESRRRFPPPWTVEEYRGISFIVRDANNFAVAYVYFESEPGRRAASRSTGVEPSAAANLMTKGEARRIAAGIAKLPELLQKN